MAMGEAVDEAWCRVLRQWMPKGCHQHQWVIAKRQGLQMFTGRSGRDDPQIRHALGDRLHDPQARQLLDIDTDAWVLGQIAGQQFGQVFSQGCRVAQQPHLALLALRILGQVELQALDLLLDQPGMLQQRLARRGRLHAPAIAFKQWRTQ
ncbi:hypothetical protein D3C76_1306420 [compost metagenome]